MLHSMFTVQPSAHPSLHGICGYDSDSATSGASNQDALFEMGSTASTCTVPHKSEFGVSLEMDVDADFHIKEAVRCLWRICKRVQNSVGETTIYKKERRSGVLPPFGMFGCHQSKRKLVSRNCAELT